MPPSRHTHVVIPVKAFARAKARLSPALSLAERADLARRMATGVLRVVGPERAWVVCDDPEVAAWTRAEGAWVSWQADRGLNGAVRAAVDERFAAGATRVLVVHSDLPLVRSLAAVESRPEAVVLVPDRHGDGTNVVATSAPGFRFAYGPGSFDRHLAEAGRLGLSIRIVREASLGWDVDEPADLTVFGPAPATPTPG